MKALASLFLACVLPLAANAQAPAYPNKPIRLIVPFAAGGLTDQLARVVSEKLAARLGQPVVVDNKPGGDGTVGVEMASRGQPDGYTLLLAGSNALTVAPALKPGFNPLKEFEAISNVASYGAVILVHPSHPARNLAELVEASKRDQGKLSYGSESLFTMLIVEFLKARSGLDVVRVPYKGSSAMYNDLLAGHIKMGISGTVGAGPHVASGKMRGIAVSTAERSDVLPNVPTIAEQGFAGFDMSSWSGVFAPKDTPRPILDRLSREMVAIVALPDVREKFKQIGAGPIGNTREQFTSFLEADMKRWAEAVKASGVKQE